MPADPIIMVVTTTAFAEILGRCQTQMGEAVVEIMGDVGRCAAINVNPANAIRQPDHLSTMRQAFGHSYLGVFGRVITPGAVRCGDTVRIIIDN